MQRPQILNVLADRYASTPMLNIWSTEAKIIMERQLWIAVLYAQSELGMGVNTDALEAYERATVDVHLESIKRRELKTRHDVKARIEEFNALASELSGKKYELIHTGMTSRDLTENVEQMQVRKSMEIVHNKLIAVLGRLAKHSVEYQTLPMAGRSHNVAAQMTTLGKRFASTAEELQHAWSRHREAAANYPLRGIKGPVGTQQDMLELLGTADAVHELEKKIAAHLGFDKTFTSVGQIYPRSLDFDVISALVNIGAVASSFATTVRLMAGQELVTEGFKEGQVGSSAMPHKMNTRSCERICGFYNLLRGYLTMIEGIAGSQWNEGDVSCSVVRRVALQDAFLAIDGMIETWLTVLDEFGAYPAMIGGEVTRYLPFLTTTKLLMAAVQTGMGREEAHAIIKKHAVEAALSMREHGDVNTMVSRLTADKGWPLNAKETGKAIGKPIDFIGLAERQVVQVVKSIEKLCKAHPEAAAYKPEPIL
ncbi:MAG: adenylosuccinate lyase [Candidatus Pacebacteria bacterium]|nr:adenylosuccinate lyase [Candidatus Paceibacterota bacterium]